MSAPVPLPPIDASNEQLFPKLTAAQVGRIRAQGRLRAIRPGEVLIQPGDLNPSFFLVLSGELEVVRPSGTAETFVTRLEPGQFTGEMTLIIHRRAMIRLRVSQPGELIELERERLLALIQTDSELSEIIMRAFILRRVSLVAYGLGDAVLVGSAHSAGTLRIKEFLTRNGHPYTYLDLDRDADVQELLERFRIGVADIPVVIRRSRAARSRQPGDRPLPGL